MTPTLAARLARVLRPGALVAIGDGAGAPLGLGDALAEAAASVGGVRLLLGWCLAPPVPLDAAGFTAIHTIMGGYALRDAVRDGRVRYVPTRLAGVPALLHSRLRPDVLLVSLAPRRGGVFGTEVGWLPAAIDAGATVVGEINHGLPSAAAEQRPHGEVDVVAEVDRPPLEVPRPVLDSTARSIGAVVAALVPEGATLQLGPGWIGAAVAAALDHPVTVASGVVGDAVQDLEARGLLIGTPRASYLAGTAPLYRWADDRPILTRVEEAPATGPFFAVNTALQIDTTGQVNAEAVGGEPLGGLGGHPDFALAAARDPRGLSIVALPTHYRGRSTLVDRLDAPTSTPRCDVDVVVTERGAVDLRGLSDGERGAALCERWAA